MTTKLAPGLAAGVVPSEGWRLVAAVDPALVETWRAARAAYRLNDPGWREETARWQRNSGVRRSLQSPYAKALREAAAAVADLFWSSRHSRPTVRDLMPCPSGGRVSASPIGTALDLVSFFERERAK